ncbi:TetR family transcriptional regulator [Paenibacillus sp. N1-5-1-14]|uniref:TetR/AcrR family transcriptional regulator n=1 Tax=Paenibacillus radicibacter TaxID=2972488 RepID=UPI0021598D74|nr:TetR family transcriptional regulator [Paenibacillus radicibacter]MCR8645916.1 TetR family transcriptional regulator [Paenibacillus radicibacter]
MPKQTFFNLSDDKRQILIDAMMKEFSRVPLHEASVANIVKAAGIPRGSFYQYFEEKDEAYYFLLEQHSKENQETFISNLIRFEGDIFITFIEMFKGMLKRFQDKEDRNFFRNTFLNMNYKTENTFTQKFNEGSYNENFSQIGNLINKDKLNIESDKELFHMLRIIMAVTFQNLIQNFTKELLFEEATRNYVLDLNLLKKGFCKEECQ